MDKWKAPAWMVPGTRARIIRGRKYPIGTVGTVVSVQKTGHGAIAHFQPDGVTLPALHIPTIQDPNKHLTLYWELSVLNLESV